MLRPIRGSVHRGGGAEARVNMYEALPARPRPHLGAPDRRTPRRAQCPAASRRRK